MLEYPLCPSVLRSTEKRLRIKGTQHTQLAKWHLHAEDFCSGLTFTVPATLTTVLIKRYLCSLMAIIFFFFPPTVAKSRSCQWAIAVDERRRDTPPFCSSAESYKKNWPKPSDSFSFIVSLQDRSKVTLMPISPMLYYSFLARVDLLQHY